MSPFAFTTVLVAILLGTVALVFERRILGLQEAQLAALRAEEARLTREVRAAAAALATEDAERQRAEADVAAAEASIPATKPGALESETAAWIARLQQLKAVLAARPEARILEIDLLGSRELLMLAREAAFSTEAETRETLAKVRTAAARKMAQALAEAVRAYRTANAGQTPSSLAALAAHVKPPVTPAMVDRWEFLPQDPALGTRQHLLTERAPVDRDFDTRVRLQANGGYAVMSPPGAWIPNFQERLKAAHEGYTRANSGASAPNLTAVLPYVNPPLDPGTIEKLQQLERKAGKR